MKKKICFSVPPIEEVDFSIECLDENLQIEGNASAIDEETDKKIANKIRRQLAAGNSWAWCCVKVTATWKNFSAETYLGGCSYRNEKQFKQDGYFEDMKSETYQDLLTQFSNLAK